MLQPVQQDYVKHKSAFFKTSLENQNKLNSESAKEYFHEYLIVI